MCWHAKLSSGDDVSDMCTTVLLRNKDGLHEVITLCDTTLFNTGIEKRRPKRLFLWAVMACFKATPVRTGVASAWSTPSSSSVLQLFWVHAHTDSQQLCHLIQRHVQGVQKLLLGIYHLANNFCMLL